MAVYVTAGHHEEELRLSLVAAIDLANAIHDSPDEPVDVRRLLCDHGFTRAPVASDASLRRVEARLRELLPDLRSLAGGDVGRTAAWLNEALRSIRVEPWLTSHDGAPLHIHWTRPAASDDDHVMADMLMSLMQEVVDHGTSRFGTCAADGCEHLFYDTTRNRSRRFCADPRCASRTHTAVHRARQRQGSA